LGGSLTPADYLPDDPAGGEENDLPTVDDPDDFDPRLLHVGNMLAKE